MRRPSGRDMLGPCPCRPYADPASCCPSGPTRAGPTVRRRRRRVGRAGAGSRRPTTSPSAPTPRPSTSGSSRPWPACPTAPRSPAGPPSAGGGPRWFHGRAADGTRLDVPVAVDRVRGVRRRPGVELSEDWLFDGDIESVDGLRVTRAERSVSYEVCRRPDADGGSPHHRHGRGRGPRRSRSLERYTGRLDVVVGVGRRVRAAAAARSPAAGRERVVAAGVADLTTSSGATITCTSRQPARCSTCPADTC